MQIEVVEQLPDFLSVRIHLFFGKKKESLPFPISPINADVFLRNQNSEAEIVLGHLIRGMNDIGIDQYEFFRFDHTNLVPDVILQLSVDADVEFVTAVPVRKRPTGVELLFRLNESGVKYLAEAVALRNDLFILYQFHLF